MLHDPIDPRDCDIQPKPPDNPYSEKPLLIYRMRCNNPRCGIAYYMFESEDECPSCGEEMHDIELVDLSIHLNRATGETYVAEG